MKRIHVVETPAATSPVRPSYEELLACLKATAAELADVYASEGLHPTVALTTARTLIAMAGG